MTESTHRTMADYYAGLPVQQPQPVTIYAAVIEWPSRMTDAEPSLILARSEAERDEKIAAEIRDMAKAQSAPGWSSFSAGHLYYPRIMEAWIVGPSHPDDQPVITTYERTV